MSVHNLPTKQKVFEAKLKYLQENDEYVTSWEFDQLNNMSQHYPSDDDRAMVSNIYARVKGEENEAGTSPA